MHSSPTEAVTHLSYDSEPPTVFALADDLFDTSNPLKVWGTQEVLF
nr:MAG TPA: hypothetical protein [Caudoviricetes sp.]